jgi:hypothetical protein
MKKRRGENLHPRASRSAYVGSDCGAWRYGKLLRAILVVSEEPVGEVHSAATRVIHLHPIVNLEVGRRKKSKNTTITKTKKNI